MTLDLFDGNRPLLTDFTLDNLFKTVNFESIDTGYPFDYYIDKDTGTHIIEYALAGFSEDELHLDVDNNKLLIFVKQNKESDINKHYFRRGISKKALKVSWEIPPNLDMKGIKAKFTDGILRITIPESADSKEKKFSIDINK